MSTSHTAAAALASARKPKASKPEENDPLNRIAARRIPNAVHAIELIGNLGSYKPSNPQIVAMRDILTRALDEALARLVEGKPKTKRASFQLPK